MYTDAGVGNYVIQVQASDSDEPLFNLWMVDSGDCSKVAGVGGYDWVYLVLRAAHGSITTINTSCVAAFFLFSFFSPISQCTARSMPVSCFTF